jgi:hypothetical protein
MTVRIRRGDHLEHAARACAARLAAASAVLHRTEATRHASSSHILPAAAVIAPHNPKDTPTPTQAPPGPGLDSLAQYAFLPDICGAPQINVDGEPYRLHPGVEGVTSVAVAASSDSRAATVTIQAVAQVTECGGGERGADGECLISAGPGPVDVGGGSLAVAFAATAAARAASRYSQCVSSCC